MEGFIVKSVYSPAKIINTVNKEGVFCPNNQYRIISYQVRITSKRPIEDTFAT
jgi:hypothetical protein